MGKNDSLLGLVLETLKAKLLITGQKYHKFDSKITQGYKKYKEILKPVSRRFLKLGS